MPTVKREDGFEIMVLTSPEHNPPHVHVYKAGAEIRVTIGATVAYLDHKGKMSVKELAKAVWLVEKHNAACMAAWRKYNAHL